MSIRLMVVAALGLLTAAAPVALAQSPYPRLPSPFEAEPDDSFPGCTKMCPQDYAPCDPYYFKQADARCQVNQRGGRHHH